MGHIPQRPLLIRLGLRGRRGGHDPRRIASGLSAVSLIVTALLAGGAAGGRPHAGTGSQAPISAVRGQDPDTARRDRFPTIAILCYHDISDDPGAREDAIPPDTLRAHIHRAKASGWTFVRVSDLLAARAHPESLPERALALTFDDGYRSFVTRALPILREEHVPATLAIVSDFVDNPPEQAPPILSWTEIGALDRSDDVKIASHSHGLHYWVRNDPQGDTSPSVATRRYLTGEGRYEDRSEYAARIRRDMHQARDILRAQLGHDVDTYVWPYGEYNDVAVGIAAGAGFTLSLALGDRLVTAGDLRAGLLPRYLVQRGQPIAADDRWMHPPRPVLAAQVDLDEVWDPESGVFERNIERLIAQVRRIGATHVFLQACPDPHGDGFLRETWFMNHQAPVRADVWSFVANRLRRADLGVWVRAPSLNLTWAWQQHPDWRIPFRGSRRGMTPWYFRVSPDLPEARQAALDFYADLAVYLPIDGVLFDDDAYLLPGERLREGDPSPAAKADVVREHLEAIKKVVRAWRPECRFGRNLYAPVVERAGVHPQFAQDLERTLRDGDLAVVMAYAHMEGHAGDAERWAGTLARHAVRRAQDQARLLPSTAADPPILFKLQAYDWEEEAWIPGATLLGMARAARAAGIRQLGVYPILPSEGDLPTDLLRAPPQAPAKGRTKPNRRHVAGAP